MRRLPIGIQDFAKIRENGFCYVDKTARIHQLISGSGGAFFLSRPRRFGKSLLCSTLAAIFEGKRDLFDGIAGYGALAIDALEWEWKKHPVLRLDLNAEVYSNGVEALHRAIYSELQAISEKFKIELERTDVISQFKYLIRGICEKTGEKAVVIIDEYDKPLLGSMNIPDFHEQIRNALKGFYGILKSYDQHLRFVFITGVSKFSHVSIFSDLNHLSDLTLNPDYADICGLTQEEVEQNFGPEIEAVLKESGKSRDEYLDKLRRYYNGYQFSKKPLTVYNPFGLLQHFNEKGEFRSYWYDTGTPTFLIDLITQQKINISDLSNTKVSSDEFGKFDIKNMSLNPLLYQTGYLTVTDYDEETKMYKLDFPNDEVRISFSKSLLEHYVFSNGQDSTALNSKLIVSLFDGSIEETMQILRRFFAAIPYDIIIETEKYYQTVVHLIFTMLGFNCRSEVRIAAGRIDTLVETTKFVYCFEFKLDGSAEKALRQIDTKEYLLPWQSPPLHGAPCNGGGKKLFKIGVNFDREKRNIGEWKYETVG